MPCAPFQFLHSFDSIDFVSVKILVRV
jgi:hypothetical protein